MTEPRIRLVPDDRGGTTVVVDGHPQSHVSLVDPELLVFEYVQHLALAIGVLPPGPLAVTHVGGAGLTIARWVAATRPGSPQIVLEPDDALTDIVRRELPLPRGHRIRVRPLDGRTGIAGLRDGSADVVVLDAYARGRVPAELATASFLEDVARVLKPTGVLLANIADRPDHRYLARFLAGVAAAGFVDRAVLATHDVLRGRRFGNLVVIAGRDALDVAAVRRQVSTMPFPAGILHGPAVDRLVAGARPLTATDRQESPEPPDPGTWRRV